MASTLENCTQGSKEEKDFQESINKASYLKGDAEFKKIFGGIFGHTKDLRVCLTRIPDHLGSGKGFDYFSSLMKNGTCKETVFVVKEEENKQNFGKKRKVKTITKTEHTKKRKTESVFKTVTNGETNVTTSEPLRSILPTSNISQHNILPSHSKTREEKRTDIKCCSQEKQRKSALNSNVIFDQSHSFHKSYTEDIFPVTPPEKEETIRDEKIRRLKQVLREKEAALEEMHKMQQK
ncbi:ligand-dependent nuclear receptor-interacting factor 1-like [Heterocephalus glaber]|uniref:Ligand-dependent nuclear receptor-interacting factor 1-like n=1 Tax=Heterocephalus glaber TaxID=10181 RepID=A0AAX6P151_HETGA|nr:ligand-dependent nuclear receptor-interacting factor 1-like [Heterocephalus glaber]